MNKNMIKTKIVNKANANTTFQCILLDFFDILIFINNITRIMPVISEENQTMTLIINQAFLKSLNSYSALVVNRKSTQSWEHSVSIW